MRACTYARCSTAATTTTTTTTITASGEVVVPRHFRRAGIRTMNELVRTIIRLPRTTSSRGREAQILGPNTPTWPKRERKKRVELGGGGGGGGAPEVRSSSAHSNSGKSFARFSGSRSRAPRSLYRACGAELPQGRQLYESSFSHFVIAPRGSKKTTANFASA